MEAPLRNSLHHYRLTIRSMYLCLLLYMSTIYFQMYVSCEVIEETSGSQEIQATTITVEDKQMFLHIVEEQVGQINNVKMIGLYKIVSELLLNEDSDKLSEHVIHKYPHAQYPPQQSTSTQPSGWTNVLPPSCVKPGATCTNDYRNITENRSGWTNSVSELSENNFQSKTCCNKDLCNNNYCCTPTPAAPDHSVCIYDYDCCDYDLGKSICDTTVGVCKIRMGKPCTLASQCIRGECDNGICCYPSLGIPNPLTNSTSAELIPCHYDSECCGGGTCGMDGICHAVVGGSCLCGANCVSGSCVDGECCYPPGGQCDSAVDCCAPSSLCTDNKCCQPPGGQCDSTDGCCASNSLCTDNKCCHPPGGQCDSAVGCCAYNSQCPANNKCCSPINGQCVLDTDCCGNGPVIYCNPSHQCHQIQTSTVCQNSNMQLMCGAGESLHIIYANFGRTSTTVCPNVNGQNTSCYGDMSTAKVKQMCEGSQSCNVAATNANFGNPCPGTYKYLEVKYDCI